MPDDNDNLSSIADYYASQGMSNPQLSYDQNGNPIFQSNKLPVDISNLQDYAATLPVATPNPLPTHETWINPIAKGSLTDALTGLGGGERYQLFPERIVRSALSLPTDVMSGKLGPYSDPYRNGPITDRSGPVVSEGGLLSSFGVKPVGGNDPEDELLQRVQDMAALMGGGGVAMAEKGALGTAGGGIKQIYRGEYSGNKGGKFWTDDPEFARQFTQSGQEHEVLKNSIDSAHIYKPDKDVYAGDPDAVDKAVAEARAKGFKAVELSEGQGQPNSTYVFNKTALKGAILKSDNEAAAPIAALENNAYHGTRTPGFERFNTPDPGQYMPDRALGTHVSKDPEIANTFVKDNGAVYPVKIPDDKHFFEVQQDLLPYIEDKATPKTPRNVGIDQNAVETAIFKTAYRKDSDMFARFLQQRWNTTKEQGQKWASDILSGKPFHLNIDQKRTIKGLDDYAKYDGVIKSWNEADRAKAIDIFKKDLQDKGYVGVKYINTSPMETANAKDPTSYIVFDPSKHIKSKYTNTLMSDTTKPGMAIAALEKAPVFHSAVENAVNTASLKSAPPQQWLSTIANAKGVKPEELDWTGLKDFLQEQKGPVSKEQIQQYLEGNKVELKEVNKGIKGVKPLNDEETNEYDLLSNMPDRNWSPEQRRRFSELDERANAFESSTNENSTKYSKYQLPGGENYREKLLTLPNDIKLSNHEVKWEQKGLTHSFSFPTKEAADSFVENALKDPKLDHPATNIRVEQLTKPDLENRYKSSHWDEPNVLAHIRMNDRSIPGQGFGVRNRKSGNTSQSFATREEAQKYFDNLPEGMKKNIDIVDDLQANKKALHIEEIQSDWHQQGREQGYKITDAQKKELESIDNKLTSKLSEGDIGNPDMDAVLKTAVEKNVITSQEAANYKQWSKGENSNIPDAPFKKTWLDLAAKRMIREAAEQGKDVLSWTPGEAQAARYPDELRRVVSSIGWGPPDRAGLKYVHAVPKEGGKHMVFTVNPEGKVVEASSPQAKGKGLDELFGKDMAKQIMEQKEGDIDGKDFVMGGKFLMDLYNVKLPQILKKLTGQDTKQHDFKIPSRVGTGTELINGRYQPVKHSEQIHKINYIDLPQSVKDTALHKGFPLFSSGLMLNPVEDNPFAKSKYKLVPVDHNPFEEKK